MGSFIALVKRELETYFISPMAYIVITALTLITGYFFYGMTITNAAENLPAKYSDTILIILNLTIFITPLVTMRLIAEEKNKGTIETLMTAPITDLQVVLSKFIASVCFYIGLILPTLLFLVLLRNYTQLDYGEVIGGYITIVLAASAFFSIGLFISSLTSSQVTAGVVTLVISILLLAVNLLSNNIKDDTTWKNVLEYIDLSRHAMLLLRGIIDSRDIVYFLSVIVLFIFLTVRVVESRRWR